MVRTKLSAKPLKAQRYHSRRLHLPQEAISPPARVDNVWKDYLGFGKLGTADMRAVATLQR